MLDHEEGRSEGAEGRRFEGCWERGEPRTGLGEDPQPPSAQSSGRDQGRVERIAGGILVHGCERGRDREGRKEQDISGEAQSSYFQPSRPVLLSIRWRLRIGEHEEDAPTAQVHHRSPAGPEVSGLCAPALSSYPLAKRLPLLLSLLSPRTTRRCDVCCLQEFWFNDYLRDLYQEELGHLYSINSLQRTRSEDGVAILMLKEKFHIVNQHDIYFREHSNFGHDRVALVVLAQLANVMTKEVAAASVGDGGGERPSASAKGTCSPPIAIVTSHLTYPHNKLDEISRLEQSKVMVGKTREFIENSCPSGTPVIIAGDFNGISEDQVCGQMRSSGYLDAFSQATGIHHSSERITHCDHRKEQKGVDYIWVSSAEGNAAPIGAGERAKAEGSQGAAADPGKGGRRDAGAQSRRNMLPFDETAGIELCAMEAYLLPRDIPCNTKMHRPKFGDFRAPDKAAREGGEESLKTAKLTLNSYDSYNNVEDPSFAGDLDWRSWCNMSDHRPMVVHFDMYGS